MVKANGTNAICSPAGTMSTSPKPALGTWGYRSQAVEAALNPLLNVAQTMPHYSYLVPVIVLFGVGDNAAAIATIIFATPPMVRLTLLGLKNVPADVVDAGMMNGCTNFQLMFRVLLPTAKRDVLIGVNQVVMQCLAMTVIASFMRRPSDVSATRRRSSPAILGITTARG